jgi:hypothetical protein
VYLTKYFNVAQNWDHYANGSFKIGTLAEYRKAEAGLARMSDNEEGLSQYTFGGGTETYDNLQIGGLFIGRMELVDCGPAVGMDLTFNDHVFCASCGPYSQPHHAAMRNGDGQKYLGNSDLDGYAVLDLNMFYDALISWAQTDAKFETALPVTEVFSGQAVSYENRNLHQPLASNAVLQNVIDSERYKRTVFHKPERFSIENEFRIAISASKPNYPDEKAEAFYPQSESLRKSIVKMGKH